MQKGELGRTGKLDGCKQMQVGARSRKAAEVRSKKGGLHEMHLWPTTFGFCPDL